MDGVLWWSWTPLDEQNRTPVGRSNSQLSMNPSEEWTWTHRLSLCLLRFPTNMGLFLLILVPDLNSRWPGGWLVWFLAWLDCDLKAGVEESPKTHLNSYISWSILGTILCFGYESTQVEVWDPLLNESSNFWICRLFHDGHSPDPLLSEPRDQILVEWWRLTVDAEEPNNVQLIL